MKKRYLSFLLIAWASMMWAQENPPVPPPPTSADVFTAREVAKMVVFPGCESQEGNKLELQKCFGGKLSELLAKELGDRVDDYALLGYESIQLKVYFVVSKEGKMTSLKLYETTEPVAVLVGNEVLVAMQNIADQSQQIKPAELSDGSKVNMSFTLPVNFNFVFDEPSESASEELIFPYTEMTISTLIGEQERYEVRFNREINKVRVYEISSGKEIFLGNFNHPYEMAQIEPYRSIIEGADNRNLVVEYRDQNKTYRIYTHNEVEGKVFVYQLDQNQETLVEELDRGEFLKSEKYMKWVLHN